MLLRMETRYGEGTRLTRTQDERARGWRQANKSHVLPDRTFWRASTSLTSCELALVANTPSPPRRKCETGRLSSTVWPTCRSLTKTTSGSSASASCPTALNCWYVCCCVGFGVACSLHRSHLYATRCCAGPRFVSVSALPKQDANGKTKPSRLCRVHPRHVCTNR